MARPTVRDVHVDTALSNISIAYKNQEYIADQVFPVVQVQKKSDVYYVFDQSDWFRRRAALRAPGTRAQRGDYVLTTASYNCLPYAFAKPVTDEERENADAALQPDITATEFATDAIMIDKEIRVANLVTASTNWGTANIPGTLWENDNSDPWGDISLAKSGVVFNTGHLPNVAVLSWGVWRYLQNHPDFLDRVKYTRPSGRIEPEDLRSWFGFDKVLIGMSVQDTALEGQSASRSYVWGNDMWIGYVPMSPGLRTPAAGYVFQWMSRKVERFREDQEHQDVIAVEEHCDERVTASEAGAIIANCVTASLVNQ